MILNKHELSEYWITVKIKKLCPEVLYSFSGKSGNLNDSCLLDLTAKWWIKDTTKVKKKKLKTTLQAFSFKLKVMRKDITDVGTQCALSSDVDDEIAEFIFHTDLFNCWTCLHVLNQI